jgi:Heterokaryon incompatibility protein (HET)
VHQQKAKHRYEACACDLVSFEEADLVRIMRSGGIPGISQCGFPTFPEEQRSYHLVDVTGNNFVAISHVWSHGLGNPSSNALPVCQLRYLFELIRKISSTEVYLWIDTISVPVTREHKKIALRTLGQVYRQAHHVLVIDRHLVQVGLEPYERQLQLRPSEWIGRLWTFQEGRLAKNLYIQFKDGAVPASELLQTPLDIGEIEMRAMFCDFEWNCRKPLEYILTNNDDGKQRLFDLAPALAFRSVTDPNDEPICIATLLELDFDRFQSEPSMMDIYQSLTELPRAILFLPGPRLHVPGFRWAPSTFMTRKSWEPRAQQLPGTLGDGGFQIHTDCIFLSEDFGKKFSYASRVLFNVECEGVDDFLVGDRADTVDDVLAAAGPHQFAILLSSPASRFRSGSCAVLVSFEPLDQFHRCRYVMGLLVLRTSRCTNSLVARLENYSLEHVFTVKGKPGEQVFVCVS